MKFGVHNPSWVFGPDPAETFEGVKAKAQWAEDHGFTWFSVMDHLIQIPPMGEPDEPFMEGWTVLSALAAVTSRIRLATLVSSVTDLVGQYRDAGVQLLISSAFKNDKETHELLASHVIPQFA
jgi:hypothetical protein